MKIAWRLVLSGFCFCFIGSNSKALDCDLEKLKDSSLSLAQREHQTWICVRAFRNSEEVQATPENLSSCYELATLVRPARAESAKFQCFSNQAGGGSFAACEEAAKSFSETRMNGNWPEVPVTVGNPAISFADAATEACLDWYRHEISADDCHGGMSLLKNRAAIKMADEICRTVSRRDGQAH